MSVSAARTSVSERVRRLHERMTTEEKLAQIVGFWVDQSGGNVAPLQGDMTKRTAYEDATAHGLGHLTRVYGTRPVDPIERAGWLWAEQRRLKENSRLGIPAIVHEECLTGLAAWRAATFPTPLAWGAAFDPDLVGEMAALVGGSMRTLGVHQGLAPVLDVIRDPRWGRVDECIGEDPYLVGTVGTAYVRGLQGAGVHATLKHFVGYSASQAGRNHAPVHAGEREIADVFLPPFEMAVRDGGARSVMNAYTEIDGVPVAGTPKYLTDLLRGTWGFDGTVVADYFAVAFLHLLHGVASDLGDAAGQALAAGIDVELPTGDAYTAPLAQKLRDGVIDEALVDRAVLRVLAEKEELGLLDEAFDSPPTSIDLDSPAHRSIARRLAEESIVLLSNDGVLPLAPTDGSAGRAPRRIAVIGPNADRPEAMLGCYSFINHVMAAHPDVPYELTVPSVLDAVRAQFSDAEVVFELGCSVEGGDGEGIPAAVRAALAADVAIVVAGDQAGLFGRGTVGEGNDVDSLDLPGRQRELIEAVAQTGTPTVVALLTGRPYAIDWLLDDPAAPGAVLQAFFPGEEGGPALARILAGAANPSGRLPVSLPRATGSEPYSYLHPPLGGFNGEITSADNTPTRPFGFGLSYTTFAHTVTVPEQAVTGATVPVTVRVRNTGDRPGADVVQLYARDVYGSVTRPVAQLVAYRRVELMPGEEVEVRFAVPPTRLAFTDRSMRRVVEPGEFELWAGPSCADKEATAVLTLTGEVYELTGDEPRIVSATTEIGGASSALG